MYFTINYTARGNSRYSDEPYGDWYEERYPEMIDATISKGDNHYGDVALFPGQEEPKQGDDIFLVWAEYGSGDSFGSSTGNVEMLWAFTNADDAFALEKALEEDNTKNPQFDFDWEKGNKIVFKDVTISTSTWKGYFEHLQNIHVDRIMVR